VNGRFHPLLPALVGTTVLGMGLLGWLASGLRPPGQDPASARLLDLLQGQPAPVRSSRPAPRAPLVAWSSPMARSCPAVEDGLRLRLRGMRPTIRRINPDPSNFGERFDRDAFGNRVDPTPRLVVLHETVYGLQSAISTFLTPHPNDDDQVSYHTLVGLDGEIVEVLPSSKRAFGAGNSAFRGEWVVTNPSMGGSINNFALHLSLETPLDGEDAGPAHSGYTPEQYDALALVLADWMRRYRIPWQNITTHRHVDLGGARADPRSFDWESLRSRLIALGVADC
jgi:N-acetylmuramoyl-L-alanine amidase